MATGSAVCFERCFLLEVGGSLSINSYADLHVESFLKTHPNLWQSVIQEDDGTVSRDEEEAGDGDHDGSSVSPVSSTLSCSRFSIVSSGGGQPTPLLQHISSALDHPENTNSSDGSVMIMKISPAADTIMMMIMLLQPMLRHRRKKARAAKKKSASNYQGHLCDSN